MFEKKKWNFNKGTSTDLKLYLQHYVLSIPPTFSYADLISQVFQYFRWVKGDGS